MVAKGYTQRYGIDYEETFSPVVRFSSVHTLLAHAVQNNLLIHQMDVVTAFLNGKLEEEIYMQQPIGFEVPGKEHLVCKLRKALYGLKQSPRCWNRAFQEFMQSNSFVQSSADPCVYTQFTDILSIVAVYVDDLIIITAITGVMHSIKQMLSDRFKMKDMGEILGVSVLHGKDWI